MNTQVIKHRLIGVLVFCAIAAAFLPVLFHHAHPEVAASSINLNAEESSDSQQIQLQLPQQATAPVKILSPQQAAQQTPEISEKLLKTANVAAQAQPKIAAAATAVQALSLSSDLPTAWVIQLGTFKAAENAKTLLAKLRDNGLTAYTRDIKQQGRSFVRVYVGPQIDRHQTEVLQQKLQTEFGVSGVIAKYDLNDGDRAVS